jgi:hypothetical protein
MKKIVKIIAYRELNWAAGGGARLSKLHTVGSGSFKGMFNNINSLCPDSNSCEESNEEENRAKYSATINSFCIKGTNT